MLALATVALAFTAGRQPSAVQSVHRLRGGGLPSVEDAQKYLGYLSLASGAVGFAFPQETLDMYEFKGAIEPATLSFAKMNFAMQMAVATLLLSPENFNYAVAGAIYSWAAAEADNLQAPRLPVVAWAGFALAAKQFPDIIPDWVFPAALVASGLHGNLATAQQAEMYKIGTRGATKGNAVVMGKQSLAMAGFTNAAFVTSGLLLLAPMLGLDANQGFGAFALAYTAFILKFIKVDGGEDLFNPAGGYVWAALFGAAGLIAFNA